MDGAYQAMSVKASRMRRSRQNGEVLHAAMNEFTLEEKQMLDQKE